MRPTINAALLLALACAAPAPKQTASDKTAPPSVSVATKSGGMASVTVEIADDAMERAQGLMHRTQMDENAGMLFIFPAESHLSFWMKDTLIPLDMLFIKADLTVLGIVENAEPMTETSRAVDGNAMYVLEVNGGWCKRHDVVAGARVKLENVKR